MLRKEQHKLITPRQMWTRDRLFRRFISRIITIHHNTHFTLPSTEPAHSSCCFPFQRLTRGGGKTVNKLFLLTKIAHFPCEAFTMITFDAENSYQRLLSSSFVIHASRIKFVGFIRLTFAFIHFPFHDNIDDVGVFVSFAPPHQPNAHLWLFFALFSSSERHCVCERSDYTARLS